MHLNEVLNIAIAMFLVVATLLVLNYYFKRDTVKEPEDDDFEEQLDFKAICNAFLEHCDAIDQEDYEATSLSKSSLESKLKERDLFRLNRRKCYAGDIKAKKFMIAEIVKFLTSSDGYTAEDRLMCWDIKDSNQSPDLKFLVISYLLEKAEGDKWFNHLMETYGFHKPKMKNNSPYYIVTEEDINEVWNSLLPSIEELSDEHMIDIFAQRVYQFTNGNGVIDVLLDASIDGVSIGVSGVPSSILQLMRSKGAVNLFKYDINYNSVWVLFRGNQTQLRFLGFESSTELRRVCKNLYSFGNPKQLSAVEGCIVNTRATGDRVTVVRPSFSNNWAAFVRMFGSISRDSIESLITDPNAWKPIETLKWIFKSATTIIVTGGQGTGKTTLLVSCLQFLYAHYTIRTIQLTSELHLNTLLPGRHIVELFETLNISFQEAIDYIKKMDGDILGIGETANYATAALFLQSLESPTSMGFTTGHMVNPDACMNYYTQAQMIEMNMPYDVAQQRAASLIKFNVHLAKNMLGHRYITRITQFRPATYDFLPDVNESMEVHAKWFFRKQLTTKFYTYHNIVERIGGAYYFTNTFSPDMVEAMMNNLSEPDRIEFKEFLKKIDKELEEKTAEKAKEASKLRLFA